MPTFQEEREKADKFFERFFVIFFAIVVTIFAALIWRYTQTFGCYLSQSKEEWGLFGDYIGGIMNPIIGLSGFVFIGLGLYASMLQLRASSDSNRQTRLARWEERVFQYLDYGETKEFEESSANAFKFAQWFAYATIIVDTNASKKYRAVLAETLNILPHIRENIEKEDHAKCLINDTLNWFLVSTTLNREQLVRTMCRVFGPTIRAESPGSHETESYLRLMKDFRKTLQFYAALGFCIEKTEDEGEILLGLFAQKIPLWSLLLSVFATEYEAKSREMELLARAPNKLWIEQIPKLYDRTMATEKT